MTKILALDTATEACSVALWNDGDIFEQFEVIPRLHSQRLLPMIEQLLAEHQLNLGAMDALAFGRGPGAFTGLRIATGMIQGLAFAADKPVCPVSTLAALGLQGARESGQDKVLAAIDARMDEVYWGCYEVDGDNLVTLLGEEQVTAPGDVIMPEGWLESDVAGIGSGWGAKELFPFTVAQVDAGALPRAAMIAELAARDFAAGNVVIAEQAQPVYLRNKVAKKISER